MHWLETSNCGATLPATPTCTFEYPATDRAGPPFEVKTHDAGFWHEHARMVNDRQLARISAQVPVWCVTSKRPPRSEVEGKATWGLKP